MKICPNCGHQNADDVKFCENCGTALTLEPASQLETADQKACPRCQALNPSDSRFCENCGYDFDAPAEPSQAAKTVKESAPDDGTDADAAANVEVDPVPATKPDKGAAPQPRSTTKNKTKFNWLISAVILLLVLGGAYFVDQGTGHTAKKAATPTEKKATSSAKSSQSATSHASSRAKPAVTFKPSVIKDDIASTVGALDGTTSAYVSPVNRQQSVLVNNGSQRSASSIKIFILVTAYAMAKEGIFNLDSTHTVTDNEKVGGTGVIQNMAAGTKLSYREVLKHMIDDSDNTGANIMIAKMGGLGLINNKIKSMGATDTKLRRKMMDTAAIDDGRDNTTSARDVGETLKKLYNHQLVSKSADDEMLTILSQNSNRNKLPKLLPNDHGLKVYNKTGEYADYGVQNDAEIVANQRGAFVAVVLSEDGKESDQVSAMNQLGLKLYQNILEE